jgi:S-adenosylmethionine:tRNA ribosyltransferase-isomerase
VPPLATELFDYELPPHLVAQTPAPQPRRFPPARRRSRHPHVSRTTRSPNSRSFYAAATSCSATTPPSCPPGLLAKRPTGGQVECFLYCGPVDGQRTRVALPHQVPAKNCRSGATFAHESGALFTGEIVAKVRLTARLWSDCSTPGNDEPIIAVANRLGEVPLPPYITRDDRSQHRQDLERYQTVYADRTRQVAVAAPTAGLHFTPDLFTTLSDQGVKTADITLHVGLGTFKPITTDTIEAHAIHRELYEMSVSTQQALFPPLTGRRVAVGTTTVRSVEDFLALHHAPLSHPHLAEAGLFIYPPRSFRGVDALITNFHQPRSTLLCLVAAFLSPGAADGIEWLKAIYAEAIAQEYRFFSYGDAMLIL